MNAEIANHLNITEDAILRIEEWANCLFVVAKKLGARFVSKKVVMIKKSNWASNWAEGVTSRYINGGTKCPLAARRNRTILDGVVELIKETVAKEENAQEIFEDYSKLNLWDDPMKWFEFRGMDALDICREIESRMQYAESWGRVRTAILSTAVERIQQQPCLVAEPEMEDAYHWIDTQELVGTQKQIKWAKDIMLSHQEGIALALKNNKTIPLSARWWIENRENICF